VLYNLKPDVTDCKLLSDFLVKGANMESFAVVILAAGMGTRMKSSLIKVLHPINGKPVIYYPLEMLSKLEPEKTILVVGHQSEDVMAAVEAFDCQCVIQDKQLGTAHAVKCAEETLKKFNGDVLVINGDTPLLSVETVSAILEKHRISGNAATLLSLKTPTPFGLGRVVRDENGSLVRIVEEKDASESEKLIDEISTGVYVFKSDFLFPALSEVKSDNAQGEYYLPDVIQIALNKGKQVGLVQIDNGDEVLGINNRCQLAEVTEIARKKIVNHWMMEGVTLIKPDTTFIGPEVTIEPDTVIYPMVFLQGKTKIGSKCTIGPGTRITNSSIANEVLVRSYSEITDSVVEEDVTIGPFAHLRPGSVIRKKAKIGNFVESKKSEIGEGSKVSHLSYIGDTDIGKNVNIGAGTITCNYDGIHKHRTVIEDGVFIGSDTQLVAPVTVKSGSMVAAGSTVTRTVPQDSLAISRTRQENKKEWASKWKKIKSEK